MIREAVDDVRRRQRDKEVNQQKYRKLTTLGGVKYINSASIKVGDLIVVEKVIIIIIHNIIFSFWKQRIIIFFIRNVNISLKN